MVDISLKVYIILKILIISRPIHNILFIFKTLGVKILININMRAVRLWSSNVFVSIRRFGLTLEAVFSETLLKAFATVPWFY